MANRQEVKRIQTDIEGINDAIISNAEAISIAASQMVMRKTAKPQSHFINTRFNPFLNGGRKLKEGSIEAGIIDLLSSTQQRFY